MCRALLALNGRTADTVLQLLDSEHLQALAELAAGIPSSKDERNRRDFSIFSSSGTKETIPDENLLALRQYFVEKTP